MPIITNIQKQLFAKNMEIYLHAKNESYADKPEIVLNNYSEFGREKLSQQLEQSSIARHQVKDKDIQVIFISHEDTCP